MPIMAIMIAPRKALPKFLTSKFGTRAAASIIMNAFITNANIPKVRTDKGAVKNQRAGLIKVFIKPNTAAAIKKDNKLFALIPEINKVAKPRPIAVANQVERNVIMEQFSCLYCLRFGFVNERKGFVFYQQKILL